METTLPTMVQVYDKVREREYLKSHSGFFWSWDEVIRTDTISNDLNISVRIDRPFTVKINGEEYVKKVFPNNPQ